MVMLSSSSCNCNKHTSNISKEQIAVNNEWNGMAGDWDDLASGYRDALLSKMWELGVLEPPDTAAASPSRVIVDFGCGTGLLTEGMMKAHEQQYDRSISNASTATEFVCIDAAPSMLRVLQDKIEAGGWKNVREYCKVLASTATTDDDDLERLRGTVDLVVASSVMSFIPKDELNATMNKLASFLKPGGLFCHSDWPKSDDNPNGFTEEKALTMYGMGGLQKKSSIATSFDLGGGQKRLVFIGVAIKPATKEL